MVFDCFWKTEVISPCIVKEPFDFPSCLAGQTIHSRYCVSTDPVLPFQLPGIVPAELVILKMKAGLIHSLPIVTYYRNSWGFSSWLQKSRFQW